MDFGILGPLEVRVDGQVVRLGGAKQRTVLAALLLEPNRVVAAERLVELLWSGEPPETVANNLQVYVSQLRRALEPERPPGAPARRLLSRSSGYLLVVGPDQLDLHRFERLAEDGRKALVAGDAELSARTLGAALALWRGPALADCGNEAFTIGERARLEQMRLRALEDRVQAQLDMGLHADVVGELEALVSEHPSRERLCGQLMLALYRSARQADATEVFQRTRRRLVDELGLEPGPDLQRLLTQILNQDPALELAPRRQTDHPTPAGTPGTNLRLQLTSFIGREGELAEVRQLLETTRLLTLVGAGGIGKTRLGLEIAGQVLGDYPDGVWLVELASLTDPSLVPQALASSLGVREQPGQSMLEAVTAFLETRQLLLVVDNCEHLLEGCGRVLDAALRSSPGTRALATSRQPLGILGETTWRVPSLSVPSGTQPQSEDLERYDGVRLFLDRARAAQPTFALTRDTAQALIRVCRRLDGIPLALELAAVCVRGLSIEALAERLDQRFRLLVGGNAAALPRQQTLGATIDWSYELLTEQERILFGRLSVFAGGWTLAAAEKVCVGGQILTDNILGLLLGLVDKSLVSVDPSRSDSQSLGRYRLLETVREYARERLESSGEADVVRRAHAGYGLAVADGAERKLSGSATVRWLAIMEAEHDNLRGALDWSATTDPDLCLRLATTWAPFWLVRGYFGEGRQWLNRALAGSPAGTVGRARALHEASRLTFTRGDYAAAQALAEEGLLIAQRLGDLGTAARLFNGVGTAVSMQGDRAGSRTWFERSLALCRQLGDENGVGMVLANLGECAAAAGDSSAARMLYQDSLIILQNLEDQRVIAVVLQDLGYLDLQEGHLDGAGAHFRESLLIARERGDARWIGEGLDCFAHLAVAASKPARSLRLAAAAEACREVIGVIGPSTLTGWWTDSGALGLDRMRDRLGQPTAALAWAEGRAMSLEDAVTYALGDDVDDDGPLA